MNIAVVGAGYVGLVAATCIARSGHTVVCVEQDPRKLESLSVGLCPILEPGLQQELELALADRRLTFSPVLPPLDGVDMVMVAVGTPTLPSGAPDLSQIWTTVHQIKDTRASTTLVMKSTVPPGTGVSIQRRLLNNTGIAYVSNPEFLREGRALEDWRNPSRVVIGSNDNQAARLTRSLYQDIHAPCLLTDITTAELIKYASNAFLATKVSFINEIACLCDAVGASIDDVVTGIGMDPRIGTEFLRAGIGYGGSCFPKDTKALDYTALTKGYDFRLLKATTEVNMRQRMLAVAKLERMLGRLEGTTVAALGLSFKPGTDDVRDSSAITVVQLLHDAGASVRAHDPSAIRNAMSLLPADVELCQDVYDCVEEANAVALLTEWPEFATADWARVKSLMRPPFAVFDGRNALDSAHLTQLGFQYQGVGRGALR